ncbi:MAG: hypothetical protein QM756_15860 [Polyangiaceae bacterium]
MSTRARELGRAFHGANSFSEEAARAEEAAFCLDLGEWKQTGVDNRSGLLREERPLEPERTIPRR